MLWAMLAVMWLLGMVTSNTMGGLIHIMLVMSLVMLLANLAAERQDE